MAVSVAAVMRQCRNYFEDGYIQGTFRITGNALPEVDWPWVFVSGSVFHDGVWQMQDGYLTGRDENELPDEEFTGKVWLLSPPHDFLALCKTIAEYEEKNPIGAPVQESFGNYSYMRNMRSGQSNGWASVFAGQLAPYRRMYTEVS